MAIDEHDGLSRQQRVGAASRRETRNRLLAAAGEEFARNGYQATTVSGIASAAGVSLQTLYLAWGSKRALLRATMERMLAGGEGSPEDAALRFAGLAPDTLLTELAATVSEIAARAATGWALYREAAAVDPEIAADWDQLQRLRHRLFERILSEIPDEALRPGLTRSTAIDTAWLIASPDSHDLLVRRLTYTPEAFQAWMRHTLTSALLAPGE
ncbi:MAG: helix-turn-helix domain-containing protein [Thermomicrobiales bacterium]